MSYSKTTWANDSTPAINATNLNKMEQGIYEAHEALEDKVDKVNGKGLSTNDYTDTEKTKLGSIESGAQVNTVNSVNGMTGDVTLNKSDVGLGNVPNVSTNDQTPTFAMAETTENIDSGDKLSVIFGKIQKIISRLKMVCFSGSYHDLIETPTIGDGTLTIQGNGVNIDTFSANQSTDKTINITKGSIDLENVDNTSDANKPISTATQNALNTKVSNVEYDSVNKKITKTINGISSDVVTTSFLKAEMFLDHVDNTSDLDKPISTATQTELNNINDNLESTQSKALSSVIYIENASAIEAEEVIVDFCATQSQVGTGAIETNPSPNNPCPIVPYNPLRMYRIGKNLIDPQYIPSNYCEYSNSTHIYSNKTTDTASNFNLEVKKYKANQYSGDRELLANSIPVGTYNFQMNIDSDYDYLEISHKGENYGINFGRFPLIIKGDLVLTVEVIETDPTTAGGIKIKLQLEKGTRATEFEAFKGGTIDIQCISSSNYYKGRWNVNKGTIRESGEYAKITTSAYRLSLIDTVSGCDLFRLTNHTAGVPGGFIICNVFKGVSSFNGTWYTIYIDSEGYPVFVLPEGQFTDLTIESYLLSLITEILYETELGQFEFEWAKPSRIPLFEGINYLSPDIPISHYFYSMPILDTYKGRKISAKYQPDNLIGELKGNDQVFLDYFQRLQIETYSVQRTAFTGKGITFTVDIRRVNGMVMMSANIDPTSIADSKGNVSFNDWANNDEYVSNYLAPLNPLMLYFVHSSGTGALSIRFSTTFEKKLVLNISQLNATQGEWILLKGDRVDRTRDIQPAYDIYSGEIFKADN